MKNTHIWFDKELKKEAWIYILTGIIFAVGASILTIFQPNDMAIPFITAVCIGFFMLSLYNKLLDKIKKIEELMK